LHSALSSFGAFFEAAKNASLPNITGERDLLAGNALMFHRVSLMSMVRSWAGGRRQIRLQRSLYGDAASFLRFGFSVWLIPDHETRQATQAEVILVDVSGKPEKRDRVLVRHTRGLVIYVRHAPVPPILGANILGLPVWSNQSDLRSTRRTSLCRQRGIRATPPLPHLLRRGLGLSPE